MIEAKNISFSIGDFTILHELNLDFHTRKFYALLGANGAGKSTLLNLLSGAISPSKGKVIMNGQAIQAMSLLDLAQQRSFLPQKTEVEQGMTVREVLEMGRFPYQENSKQTDFWVSHYAEDFELLPFLNNEFERLSGGEQQRVQLARVLLQLENEDHTGKSWLFLDEPLNNLDLKFQKEILKSAQRFVQQGKGGVIAVMHDLNLSYRYADEVVLMDKGKVVANGKKEVLKNLDLLKQIFHTPVEVYEIGESVFFEV